MKTLSATLTTTLATFAILSLGLASGVSLPAAQAQDAPALDDENSRIAYAIGMNVAMNLQSQGLLEELDAELFLAGINDSLNGDAALDTEEMFAALEAFQQRQQAAMEEQMEANRISADENLAAGEEFLRENGVRDEVVTLDSGLQYEILVEGPGGPSPSAADGVLAHYHGTLIDGTVFDSSVDRGEPAQFMLSQVISGWTEALQLMSVGDQWRLFIPSEMAYGESSPSPSIPPNSVLIFDVELLEIVQ